MLFRSTTLTCHAEGKVVGYSQQLLQQRPELHDWMNWGNTLTITVPIDGNGSGRWDLNQVDSGYIPAGTTWLGRVRDIGSGTISNEITIVWPATATSTDQPTDPYANMTLTRERDKNYPTEDLMVIKNGPPNSTVTAEYTGKALFVGKPPQPVYTGAHTRFSINLDSSGSGELLIHTGIDQNQGGSSGNFFIVEKPSLTYYIDVPPWSGA